MRPYQYEVFRNGVKVKTAFDKDSVKGFSTNQEDIPFENFSQIRVRYDYWANYDKT
jgi:hypothetical protein